MRLPCKALVDTIKSMYPAGLPVELVRMSDPYTKLKSGSKGIVCAVDDTGTVFVNWDNGETLGAVYGEDSLNRILKPCVIARHEYGITLNDYEYVLADGGFDARVFPNKGSAIIWLRNHGATQEEVHSCRFFDADALKDGKHEEVIA